ncbi:MAG TPA: MBL fold metallo-hydrolase [Blastocatellia bacterium]|nr:MBL fold metallo-hydrolase [Blastocatellia bacterium]
MRKPLTVTMVSHACLRIEGEFGSLLCDPWFLNEPIYNFTTWKFPAAVIPPSEVVAGLDYLFITHSHEDHFHIPSLDLIPREVTVLLPEYEGHPGMRAQHIERVCRALGFHRIRKLRPWQTAALGGGAELTVLPPDPNRPHDWENAGFVIEDEGCKLVNVNDNIGDEEHFARIARRFGRFDLGLVQTTGVSMYPGRFRMSESRMREEAGRRQFNPIFQRRLIDALELKYLAPFAGDFGWFDERYFHCNWANRTTPAIFERWFNDHYAVRGVELAILLPSDTWSMATGPVHHHPPIDWEHHLDEVRRLQRRFQYKLDRVRDWIHDSNQAYLEQRTRDYTEYVSKWICRDYLDVTACFEIRIEGSPGFSFFLEADPQNGFAIRWERPVTVDQTLALPAPIWAAILEGKLMWNIAQWSGECEQHVPFRPEIARFWAWLEYYVDLGNRVPQALVEEAQHPWLTGRYERLRPQLGVFPDRGFEI